MTEKIRLVTNQAWVFLTEGIIGQKRLLAWIRKIFETVSPRGEMFPHALLTGPAGHGKTFIAGRIAESMGLEFISFNATAEMCRNDIAHIFSSIKSKAIVHIDEVHAFSRCVHEFLYEVIDKQLLPSPGERRPDAVRKIKLPPISIIFSTNFPGLLPKALRTRLMLFELDPYSDLDMADLAKEAATVPIDDKALEGIVSIAQGSPRILLQTVRQLKLICPDATQITKEIVEDLFKYRDIGPKGLSKNQQDYMKFLETQPDQKALVGSLCRELGVDENFLRDEVEPFLARCGFISYGSGRRLSTRGRLFVHKELGQPIK